MSREWRAGDVITIRVGEEEARWFNDIAPFLREIAGLWGQRPKGMGMLGGTSTLRGIADLFVPPLEEPLGLGARVTDSGGLEWAARTGLHPAPDGMGLTERRWGCLNGRATDRTWDELLTDRGPLAIEGSS